MEQTILNPKLLVWFIISLALILIIFRFIFKLIRKRKISK